MLNFMFLYLLENYISYKFLLVASHLVIVIINFKLHTAAWNYILATYIMMVYKTVAIYSTYRSSYMLKNSNQNYPDMASY